MTKISIRFFISCAIAPLALAGGQAAFAQDEVPAAAQDEVPAASGQIIIVTARKVEERLQDVPLSIAAFSAEDMRERQVRDTSDIAALTPGLNF